MSGRVLVLCAFVAFGAAGIAHAGPGHDHGEASGAPAAGNGPRRLPDGTVFLPKPAQRQIGLRTAMAEEGRHPRVHELAGKVVMDPNAGGKVQPTLAGRIEPGPRGLPNPGQRVAKGEVLAYVAPSIGSIERSNQSAQLSELKASAALAQKRLARLRSLSDTVPRKEIEAAESEVASLGERAAAVSAGLVVRQSLVAPVAGVVASANVVAGQVVEARELVFEIVDPTRLRVEALTYDQELAASISAASLAVGDVRVPLRPLGSARALREQALPLSFLAQGGALEKLALGQPVRVFAQSAQALVAIKLPSASLVKNPANQTVVWVKSAPEMFAPRTVTIEPLDGLEVAVTSGLAAGDRVVVRAATLLNQIR